MPLSADETFQLKYGACRDVTWMQIQLLRNMGIAARFVSGYFFIPEAIENAELHAWLEVYIPGAGWIGLDPSHGILTGSHHIPIASSSNHQLTMPIDGTFRGSAKSTLTSTLKIVLI
jgi:transglutaminase-like putative cysteine protease